MVRYNMRIVPSRMVVPEPEEMYRDIEKVFEQAGADWVSESRTLLANNVRHGKLLDSLTYRVNRSGGNVRAYMFSSGVGDILDAGIKQPYTIAARRRRSLKFLWETGPQSNENFTAFHFRYSVTHPAMPPIRWKAKAQKVTIANLKPRMIAIMLNWGVKFKNKNIGTFSRK